MQQLTPTRRHLLSSALSFIKKNACPGPALIIHIVAQINVIAMQNNYELFTVAEIEKYISLV
jgi:hypothetical protein